MQEYDDFAWTPRRDLARLALGPTPWEFYLNTMVRFETTAGGGAVRPCDGSDSESTPPFGPLHVVTAIQPDPEPDTVSHSRMLVLDDFLRAAGIRSIPAVGSSFTGDHSEDSRAVFGLTDRQARELGAQFGQVAVFSWNGPRWSLLACAGDRHSHRGWRREPTPGNL
ncbi:DUF3293 domain-containing protein [Rhodococcus sp. Q]|uniref:DUF3293 domain-containing protein n=1 Tax=Rhodococcus sp. Q TaxID=2502252 RepID=UPI0010F57797|nr:DUF3293 domain-containing protein [Rhodococcus sp. Q]